MKIKYLGTAAYEGVPSLFCGCETCKKSLEAGGKNLRTRSQALIDGQLLIDFPPDTLVHSQTYKLDWANISNCLITHSHSDHFYIEDIGMMRHGYAMPCNDFTYYSGEEVVTKIKDYIEKHSMPRVFCMQLNPYQTVEIKSKSVTHSVTAYPANHCAAQPLFYSIENNGKRLLYAHDTGVFNEQTFVFLKKEGYFNLVSLDCTGCNRFDWVDHHMGLTANVAVKNRLIKEGIADQNTIFVLNHFSHNGGATYDEMVEAASAHSFTVSYDGLEINF